MKALITRKVGMTSTINEDGAMEAITLLSVDPNVITQIKTEEKDGYTAYQLGTEKAKHIHKSIKGHAKTSKTEPKIMKEMRVKELTEELKVGDALTAETFAVGDTVAVTGISKGKGFAGTIKRHHFHRQRKTHGGKGNTRKVGSIGSMYPQHIFKGKKMSGQMGHTQVTTRNLKVTLVDTDLKVIGVKGAVPGPRKGLVFIKGTAS